MAWIQMDCELPEKWEASAICDATGEEMATVCGRLFLFWRWIDKACKDGIMPQTTIKSVIRNAGGDEAFWEKVEEVGWIQFTDAGIRNPCVEAECSDMDKDGFVYFAKEVGKDVVKIGFSKDPASRLKTLQTAHAGELKILHSFPGTISDERRIHEQFRDHRLSGEWFALTTDIQEFIESMKG